MAKAVVNNAILSCSFGNKKSYFSVPNGHKAITENENKANISDHVSGKNIKPFGMCKSPVNPAIAKGLGKPQPCVPETPLK